MHVVAVVAIALVALFGGYCVVGTCVRFRGGIRRCPDMMPHSRFWGDVWARCCRRRGRRRVAVDDDTASIPGEDRAFSQLPSDPAALEEFDDEDDMIGDAAV